MALDTTSQMTRRALVGGTLGAIGAAIVGALAKPLRVEASSTSLSYTNNENSSDVVFAQSVTQNGFASSGAGTAFHGTSDSGIGVLGASNSHIGVYGAGSGTAGVYGQSSVAKGVIGYSISSTGVQGESGATRGGVFIGPKAQVRLTPSTTLTTHPASGLAGDLFVDKNKHLWFCRGGSTWVRLD